MDCQKCHELLSDFLDNSLTGDDSNLLSVHLKECLSCDEAHRELGDITALARTDYAETYAPHNSRTLWLRIREQVEGDVDWAEQAAQTLTHQTTVNPTSRYLTHESWWSRVWNARWEVSAPQTAAFASVMLVVAMITAFGLNGNRTSLDEADATTTSDVASRNFAAPQMNLVGNSSATSPQARRIGYEDYVRQQQAEAEYWMQRVATRKARFTPQLLDSYERSLASLDQTVAESLDELRRNPQDEISVEILNHALQEKAELLKEFSEF
ncbi:MAG: zf-HC2 domain-containing protein [Pyrinomonadaceae bacterium MAG19_C2-C3]|nr:zf-HC2 domain-containing protein [Pyrinomonadaceae bacterium MAG19_C2-C3]